MRLFNRNRDAAFLRDTIAEVLTRASAKDVCAWAGLCAEHVIHNFEEPRPGDTRPRKAIQALRSWMMGNAPLKEVRSAAFVCFTAAGETATKRASSAARACMHAAQTARRRSHAIQAADHAVDSVFHAGGDVKEERRWQLNRLLEMTEKELRKR